MRTSKGSSSRFNTRMSDFVYTSVNQRSPWMKLLVKFLSTKAKWKPWKIPMIGWRRGEG
jgi:hypothetical protein